MKSTLLILLLFPVLIYAQRNFEGTIKYQIEYSGSEAEMLYANKPCVRMDMHFKDNNFIIHSYEGQFPKTRLYIADSSEMYILDLPNSVAYKRDRMEDTSRIINPPTATFTGDSAKIAGYMCYVYRVKKKNEITFYYVTDSIRIDPALFIGKKDAQIHFLTKGLDGRIPLKMVRKTPEITITTLAINIHPKKFTIEQFRLPEGIKIKHRDNRM